MWSALIGFVFGLPGFVGTGVLVLRRRHRTLRDMTAQAELLQRLDAGPGRDLLARHVDLRVFKYVVHLERGGLSGAEKGTIATLGVMMLGLIGTVAGGVQQWVLGGSTWGSLCLWGGIIVMYSGMGVDFFVFRPRQAKVKSKTSDETAIA